VIGGSTKGEVTGQRFVDPARDRSLERWSFPVLSILCAALCLLIVFRPFWTSHFDLVLSDPVDGRFSIVILEHWTRVLHGQSAFASPNFFFPEHGTLGFSDTLFLLAVPYTVLRSVGVDRYLSFEITVMFLSTVGFASMLYLFRAILRFAPSTSLLGATLFIVFNLYYIQIVHPQLVSVVFVPVLLILLAKYWEKKDSAHFLAPMYLAAAGILLALLLFTSFYIGWFTVLLCGTAAIFFVGCAAIAERDARVLLKPLTVVRTQKKNLLVGTAAFLVALIPFLVVYTPALRRTGTRDLQGTLFYMPSGLGVFDVGRDNWIWGAVARRIESAMAPAGLHEHPAGWPFFTVCLFLATAIYCVFRRPSRLMSALSLACITLWLAGTRLGHSAPLWAILWRWVPGAAAIRVPQRMNLVLDVGVATVCMFGFEQMRRRMGPHRLRSSFVVLSVVLMIFVEQLNFMPTHLISRVSESRKFAKIVNPPIGCSEFYVSSWSDRRPAILEFQTDAMLVAEQFGIPTLNGYSGWFPRDWDFLVGTRMHIAAEAREWSQRHGLSSGLCSLDIDSGKWSVVDLRDPPGNIAKSGEHAIADPTFENTGSTAWSGTAESKRYQSGTGTRA